MNPHWGRGSEFGGVHFRMLERSLVTVWPHSIHEAARKHRTLKNAPLLF